MALEWARHGIRVNAVCPWMTMTPLLEAAVAKDPHALDDNGATALSHDDCCSA